MRKGITILLLLCLHIPAWANYGRDVFNRLVNAAGSNYITKPVLVIVPSDVIVANTYSNGEIQVGTGLINYCRRFGSDSCDALAYVLAHELVHFYKEHVSSFGSVSSFASEEWVQTLNRIDNVTIPLKETEADELGFFYASLAGYHTAKVAPMVLDSIYRWYNLPDSMNNYPLLKERKNIAVQASAKMNQLIPLFRIANYFMLLGKYFPGQTQYVYYESASFCLEHIIQQGLKNPSVLNNLGVIYVLQSQPYVPKPWSQLFLPVVIDEEPSFFNMDQVVGSRGVADTIKTITPEGLDYLNRAISVFQEAVKINRNYIPAYMNHAVVHFFMEEQGSLQDKIKLIHKLADRQDVYQPIVSQLEAFAWYLEGDKKKMNDAFKKALKTEDFSATINHEVLNGIKSNTRELMLTAAGIMDTTEKLNDKRVIDFFKAYRPSYENRMDLFNEKFIIWSQVFPTGTLYTLRVNKYSQIIFRDMFFYEVTTQTCKGIGMGSTLQQVKKVYGEPSVANISAGAQQLLYPSQSLCISVSTSNNQVISVVYYGSKK